VKSASRPREDHVLDLAIQAYVMDGAGVELASASLLHVNPGYVWQRGPLDPSELFVRVDMTEEVFRLLPEVHDREREFRAVLAASESPTVAMGPQCRKHDVCPFFAVCRRESGIASAEAPDLSGVATAIAVPSPSRDAPIALLDIQSFSTSLPRIAGSSPHERIPFLWSLRVIGADGSVEDHQGLPSLDGDPRPGFADPLAARLPATGPIVFFSEVAPIALESLAARGFEAARVCAQRLAHRGIDLLPRIEAALGPQSDGAAWTWEALASAAAQLDTSRAFASRGEAAAAYVNAIDRATPRSHRDATAEALARYGRANLAALAVLAGVARVGPRV
jgi:hypothetical protein